MNLAGRILKLAGWRVELSVPDFPKCIICVAPHTSNWDFVFGKLAYASVGRQAGFLMKESWFVWPLGYFFRALGGVPVPRKNKRSSLTEAVSRMFKDTTRLHLAITPEGTRSRNDKWHTGFLRIAAEANVPIILGVLDYGKKLITLTDVFEPTGDVEADMRTVKEFYKGATGKYPDKFAI